MLKQRLLAGDRDSLTTFWGQVQPMGTPLVEPSTVSGEVVVTFIWRGGPEIRSVGLLAPLKKVPRISYFPLAHLHGTDVWFKTWQLSDDLRFGYRYVVIARAGEEYRHETTTDPLNPNRMDVAIDEGQPTMSFSIASMPRGKEPKWIIKQSGIPSGRVERHQINSVALNDVRTVWVYTPPGYNPPKSYSLLVLFDGFGYLNWIGVPTILDNLIRAGQIPSTVAVLIGNAPGARVRDLQYNPALANFLVKELLPWVDEHWKVSHDPRKRIIGGYSLGGTAAAFIALQDPGLFGNVLSQSGAFQEGHDGVKWQWLASQYGARAKLPLRFSLEAGRLEDVSPEGPSLLAANRHFVSILRSKGYSVTYAEIGGTHEPAHWRGAFPELVIELSK
jgi:enterochelin esterase family protein